MALERFEEAEAGLPEVQALAEALGEELDLTRCVMVAREKKKATLRDSPVRS